MLCDQMYQILEQLMFKLHGGNDQASDITAHLVRLIQCWATGDIADFVYAASEHRAGQCAAWEAVDPALDSLLGALEGLRCVLCCSCEQVGDYSVAPEAPVRNFEQQLSGRNSSALR